MDETHRYPFAMKTLMTLARKVLLEVLAFFVDLPDVVEFRFFQTMLYKAPPTATDPRSEDLGTRD